MLLKHRHAEPGIVFYDDVLLCVPFEYNHKEPPYRD